ncbi:MAG: alpha/beta hydrolase-fold protein, partial [Ferruginibacter sp.]
FDDAVAPFGEWGVDETLDSLVKAGKPGAIIVGIANGEKRMNEYNPYFFERAGAGEGDAYVQFIINELKPFIDKKFRTKKDNENTVIAGSSMGGLISYYAAIKYPQVFGRAGMFSPAFWTAPEIVNLTDSLAPKLNGMYFFYMGEKEGSEMVGKMNAITQSLGKSSSALLFSVIDPQGGHNEHAWRKWFVEFYIWITGNGLNQVIR